MGCCCECCECCGEDGCDAGCDRCINGCEKRGDRLNSCVDSTARCIDIWCCCCFVHRIVGTHSQTKYFNSSINRIDANYLQLTTRTILRTDFDNLVGVVEGLRPAFEREARNSLRDFQAYAVEQHNITLRQRMEREENILQWCTILHDRVTELERKEAERQIKNGD